MNFETLKEAVAKINGSTFISMDTQTEVKLTGGKKNPMQGRVNKITRGANVMIVSNTEQNAYENMIKKRMLEEGKDPSEFELKPRQWGTRIPKTPFVEHNGKHYLEVFFISPGKSVYTLDGVEIEKDKIEGLPEKKEVNEEAQGGIENKVVLRTFSVDSIQKIKMAGAELR